MNYLSVLEISPGVCRGFEDEAFGACVGLVGWGYPSKVAARQAWIQAGQAASVNRQGNLIAGPQNKSLFYVSLLHRHHSAFWQFGLGDIDWAKFDVANFPWALPKSLFDKLYPEVMADKGPTYERPPQWSDIENIERAVGLTTPAGAIGKNV